MIDRLNFYDSVPNVQGTETRSRGREEAANITLYIHIFKTFHPIILIRPFTCTNSNDIITLSNK